jgi:hypothetical protein
MLNFWKNTEIMHGKAKVDSVHLLELDVSAPNYHCEHFYAYGCKVDSICVLLKNKNVMYYAILVFVSQAKLTKKLVNPSRQRKNQENQYLRSYLKLLTRKWEF